MGTQLNGNQNCILFKKASFNPSAFTSKAARTDAPFLTCLNHMSAVFLLEQLAAANQVPGKQIVRKSKGCRRYTLNITYYLCISISIALHEFHSIAIAISKHDVCPGQAAEAGHGRHHCHTGCPLRLISSTSTALKWSMLAGVSDRSVVKKCCRSVMSSSFSQELGKRVVKTCWRRVPVQSWKECWSEETWRSNKEKVMNRSGVKDFSKMQCIYIYIYTMS